MFSNTAMSVDGRIGLRREAHVSLGSAEDRRRMSLLRAGADAVLVGGQTFRNWPLPLVERPEHRVADARRPILDAVITRRGLLDARPARGRWPDPRVRLLVFGPPTLDAAAHRERFGAEVIPLDEPDVGAVLDELERRGCRRVLVEGGGRMIGELLVRERLDALFVTLCPSVIGAPDAPALAEIAGSAGLRPLELVSCERVGDEVFLHYRPRRDRAPGGASTDSAGG